MTDDEIYEYAIKHLGLIDPKSKWWWEQAARDAGWIDTYEVTEAEARQWAYDWGILLDLPTPSVYHHDNGHTGTIRWCTDGVCSNSDYNN